MHELLSLLELQGALLKVDIRESIKRLIRPVVFLLAGAVIALATVPIALILIAQVLIDAGLWASIALLIVTVLGFGTAAGFAIAAVVRFRSSLNVFARSRDEWRRTVRSIKQMLQSNRHDNSRPDFD